MANFRLTLLILLNSFPVSLFGLLRGPFGPFKQPFLAHLTTQLVLHIMVSTHALRWAFEPSLA
ncbi:hypothetical protein SAMN04488002_1147 [Litoreibacter janthinus]|uniref:Uncharacterized protein n=1 Tax=Litoreibacter janthinus TaxID=670154 RepID=A0A1I6GAM3_9RHOB|nr:hypothetical protein SAMN04488002_1147 [Litoreibacter janthinus]